MATYKIKRDLKKIGLGVEVIWSGNDKTEYFERCDEFANTLDVVKSTLRVTVFK